MKDDQHPRPWRVEKTYHFKYPDTISCVAILDAKGGRVLSDGGDGAAASLPLFTFIVERVNALEKRKTKC